MRINQVERFNSYEIAIKAGFLSPNEVRQREGLGPYVGGDEFSQAWKQTVQIKQGHQDGEDA